MAKNLKGVITAGGLGTRLLPMTRVTNKHLLPVYDRPMIFYPIETLAQAGIEDIMIITGGNHAGDFLPLLGDGREFGLKRLHYTYQAREGGIAEALSLTREFVGDDHVVVMLGDNIIEKNIVDYVEKFRRQEKGARILLKEVEHPEQYGVPSFDDDGSILHITEKPEAPAARLAVTGIYMYDNRVYDIIRTLQPSGRGELEITDVNNAYIQMRELEYDILNGWWADCGETRTSLHEAGCLVAQTGANNL
ncbi:MAG: NTP transferase domain-containing protein [Candidatus Omnitrophica bacterium]|nr:NTP transferase domain-containing protein [Candidatus Omnitrophota bacterium]